MSTARRPLPGGAATELVVVDCPTCRSRTPAGAFCGACGSELDGSAAPRGTTAFAVDPGERVLRPWLATALFPYLPHRGLAPFRLALFIGTVGLVLVGLLRLSGPAIVASALLLPALYLLYVFEVGVYEDQPWLVTFATSIVGAAFGIIWTAFVGPIATQALVLAAVGRLDPAELITGGILVPLIAQAFMLVGPVLLYASHRFDHALDGFTFGVASSLGFSLAATLAQLPHLLGDSPISSAEPFAYALDVVRHGLIAPLVSASLTGLVAAAFWLHRQPPSLRPRARITTRPIALGIAATIQVGLGIADVTMVDSRLQFVAWLGAAVVLIVITRLSLHAILLGEAHRISIGPEIDCPHCLELVPFMPFCPHCGIARRATPKIGRVDIQTGRSRRPGGGADRKGQT